MSGICYLLMELKKTPFFSGIITASFSENQPNEDGNSASDKKNPDLVGGFNPFEKY